MNQTIRTVALGLLSVAMAGMPAVAADKTGTGCPRGYDCPNANCPYAQSASSQNPQTRPSQDQNAQARRERKRDGTGNGPRQDRRRDGSCVQG